MKAATTPKLSSGKTVTAYVGGLFDRWIKGVVYSSLLELQKDGDEYFSWDQDKKLAVWIDVQTSLGHTVNVSGHSWGADTAATLISLGYSVNALLTVDPVGWTRPNMSAIVSNTNVWKNYDSLGYGPSWANAVAFFGRAWNGAPKGYSNIHLSTNSADHANIWYYAHRYYYLRYYRDDL